AWQVILVIMIISQIVSCTISAQAKMWWNKASSSDALRVVHLVEQTSHPLFLTTSSNKSLTHLVVLSYLLAPPVRFQGVIDPSAFHIPIDFTDIFVVTPSLPLRQKLAEAGYRLEAIGKQELFWRLRKELSSTRRSPSTMPTRELAQC